MASCQYSNVLLECTGCKTDDCPLVTGELARLVQQPCCDHLWIPARHLTAARGKDQQVDRPKAVKQFLKELEEGR